MEGADMATVQNTLIVIGDNTISTSINPTLVLLLREVSKKTGKSLSSIMNRALNTWVDIEAPVYLAAAEKKRAQSV
jgi:hypothetical protein